MNAATFYDKSGKSPSIDIVNAFKARVLADGGTFEGEDCLIETVKKLRARGIYQRASLILTPNGFKASKLYSLTANSGATDFTVTGGGGSRIDSSGNMVAVPPGTPKIDYTNGSCPEIVMERTATNILLYSETLINQTVTMSNVNYILSFYGTGSVTVGENAPITLNGTDITNRVQIMFLSSGGTKSIIVTGQVKYAQLESIGNNSQYDFPTSWISTAGTIVPRLASTLQKTGIADLIDQVSGTIVFSLTRKGAGRLFRMDDGTDSNSIRFYNTHDGNNRIEIFFTKNDITKSLTVLKNPTQTITVAFRYNSNIFEIYLNGVHFHTLENNTIANTPFSAFNFSGNISLTNRLKYFAYIPSTSTPEELMLYSTPL